MRLRLVLLALVPGAALPAAPASAVCDKTDPCLTTCDKAVDAYDRVVRTFGVPLPPFPVACPQS